MKLKNAALLLAIFILCSISMYLGWLDKDRRFLHLEIILPFYCIILLLASFALIAAEIGNIIKYLSKHKGIVVLCFILGIFLAMRIFLMTSSFMILGDESFFVEAGKNLAAHGSLDMRFYTPTEVNIHLTEKPPMWGTILGLSYYINISNSNGFILGAFLLIALALALFFFLSVNQLDWRISVFAVTIFLYSNLTILWVRSSDSIIPALSFVMLSFLFAALYIRHKNKRMWVLSCLFSSIAILTRLEYILFVPLVFAYSYIMKKQKKSGTRYFMQDLIIFACGIAPSIVVYFLFFPTHLFAGKNLVYGAHFLSSIISQAEQFSTLLPLFIIFLSLMGIYLSFRRKQAVGITFILWSLLFFLLYTIWESSGQLRFYLAILIPVSYFAGFCAWYLISLVKTRTTALFFLFLLVVIVIGIAYAITDERYMRSEQFAMMDKTKVAGFVKQNVPDSCWLLAENQFIAGGANTKHVIELYSVKDWDYEWDNMLSSGCLMFLEGSECNRQEIAQIKKRLEDPAYRTTLINSGRYDFFKGCIRIFSVYQLKAVAAMQGIKANYTLYEIEK